MIQAGPRWTALRGVAVGLGKQHPACCQGINIWRASIGMTLQTSHPIIQVVHDNEHNVRVLFSRVQVLLAVGDRNQGNEQKNNCCRKVVYVAIEHG